MDVSEPPVGAAVSLLEESARASQCLTFGLRMAETRQLTDLGAVSLLLTHKRTLREVLLAMIDYRHLMNEALALQMQRAADADDAGADDRHGLCWCH